MSFQKLEVFGGDMVYDGDRIWDCDWDGMRVEGRIYFDITGWIIKWDDGEEDSQVINPMQIHKI